jgi:hypothetical protein
MRRRSAKHLNTGNFKIILNFSRFRIKEKCQIHKSSAETNLLMHPPQPKTGCAAMFE